MGPNASGKSNFVQIFKFLKDMATSGLDNAISMQGGGEYLTNMKIGISKELSIKIVASVQGKFYTIPDLPLMLIGEQELQDLRDLTYELTLKFKKGRPKFEIPVEKLIYRFRKIGTERGAKEGELILTRIGKKLKFSIPEKSSEEEFHSNTPLLFMSIHLREILGNIAIYDFDPKLPKRATPITGKIELEEDGSNLSLVLKNILERKEEKRKLSNLIQYLLPFVEDLSVEKFADKSMLFKMRESYFTDQYLPASLISDGTINLTAMIVALLFEKKNLTIIDEPERNVHPQLISRVVNMMKEASKKKQTIITTHNPEFVKHAGLENLLLISRDDDGFSRITRPKEKEEVKTFLENEISIEELYVQNLL